MSLQREAVHLDHALSGVQLPETAPSPELTELLTEALKNGSPEKLKQLVVAIQRYNRKSVHEFQEAGIDEKQNIDAELADREIFDVLFTLGVAPSSYNTFTRRLMYDNAHPLNRLFKNKIFSEWFIKKAHMYGIAGSAILAAMNQASLTRANFERALYEDSARAAMLMFILTILMPALTGIAVRITSGPIIKMDEIIKHLDDEIDRKAVELHKTLRCLVMLHRQSETEGADAEIQKKIRAKILIVKTLIQRALNGEEEGRPVIEPEEYGGSLAVGSGTVNRTLKIEFPKADY